MDLKYALEDAVPLQENIVYGLQWLAVSLPAVIIFAKLLGNMEGSSLAGILYMQKLFAVTAVSLLAQIWWGHRLPLVIGPATVLLIGILASQGRPAEAIYTSIMICGIILSLLAISGLFAYLRRLFTPRIVAIILLLVAFTMLPTIMKLISAGTPGVSSAKHLGFALIFILFMFAAQRFATGLWKSALILWCMLLGSLAYYVINPAWTNTLSAGGIPLLGGFFTQLTTRIIVEPGLIIAFLLCFLGLSINDLGSIQAVGSVLEAEHMPKRITRGISFTGLANALSGFMGVIGPVNFSFSPGLIASTGCAARISLIPAGVAMLILAFLPKVLYFLSFIPDVVIGCILLYIMCTQVAAGLGAAFSAAEQPVFDFVLVIGLPILIGVIVAFLPAEVVSTFPSKLRPILGNGFVMGVLVALLLEHGIFRNYQRQGGYF